MPSPREIQRQQQRALNNLAKSQTVSEKKKQEAEYIKFLKDAGKQNDR